MERKYFWSMRTDGTCFLWQCSRIFWCRSLMEETLYWCWHNVPVPSLSTLKPIIGLQTPLYFIAMDCQAAGVNSSTNNCFNRFNSFITNNYCSIFSSWLLVAIFRCLNQWYFFAWFLSIISVKHWTLIVDSSGQKPGTHKWNLVKETN